MGDFVQRIAELIDRVGQGKLSGKVTIDQVYAKYQHERLDLHHRVGKARYLADPLTMHYQTYFRRMGEKLLEPDGLKDAMIDACESLANSAAQETPVEAFNLARSAGITVRDQGAIVHRRQPRQPRLSESELRILRRGRSRRGR